MIYLAADNCATVKLSSEYAFCTPPVSVVYRHAGVKIGPHSPRPSVHFFQMSLIPRRVNGGGGGSAGSGHMRDASTTTAAMTTTTTGANAFEVSTKQFTRGKYSF